MSDPNTTLSTPEQSIPAPVPTLAERDKIVIRRLKGVAGVFLLRLAAVSFAAGVPGLLAAGGWAQLGQMAFLVPIVIDGGLVFFVVTAMSWRAEAGRAGALPWLFVVILSAAAVASQVTHVLGAHNGILTPESVVGSSVASLFPLVVLASTSSFENLRFGKLLGREAARAAKAASARGRTARSAVTRPASTPVATRPAAPARPRTAGRKAGRPVIDTATREIAVARVLAGESQRQVALSLGVGRTTLQSWLKPA